jgi:glycine/D-amino acid oxidase-like deaminating enzyme
VIFVLARASHEIPLSSMKVTTKTPHVSQPFLQTLLLSHYTVIIVYTDLQLFIMAGRVFALPSAVLLIQALFADSLSLTMNSVGNGAAPKRVVIAGSGVIGTSTAFFLAKDYGVSSTLVDPTGTIAPAASGKAGGFLALDWNDFSSVGPLARRSFGLHQEIADILGASKIQYRRLTCVSIEVGDGSGKPKGRKLDGIEWAQGHNAMASARSLGDESTIAQVHPKKLCEAMWEHVQSLMPDSTLVRGKVVKGVYDENTEAKLIGAELEDGTVVEGDALLYACGPWTADNMFGTKYHRCVLHS